MKNNLKLVLLLAFVISSCSNDDDSSAEAKPMELNFDFKTDLEGWQGDFADYPVGEETFYELDVAQSKLPEPLDQDQNAINQVGNNHSDDLFMFLKRKVTGLQSGQLYNATFQIEFATNAASNSFGVGGSPGSSVYIKAGATQMEPKKEVDSMSHYRMNIDKGNQAEEGENMINLGDFSNGLEENIYALKTLKNEIPFPVTADENGEIWLIVGTDSGFEATTSIYYNKIFIVLE